MQATKKKGRLVSARLVVNALLYPQSIDSQCQAHAFPAMPMTILQQHAATSQPPQGEQRMKVLAFASNSRAIAPAL